MFNKNPYIVKYGGGDSSAVDLEKAKVVVVPVPYEGTVTYRQGTRNGPSAIIEASSNMELFDEELNVETHKMGIYTLPPIDLSNASPENMVSAVYKTVKDLMSGGKFPVVIGGEHTVSIGAIKAVKESVGEMSVLQLDAHSDLRNEYGGTKFNHACVGRRLQEIAPLTQVGIRSVSREDKEFLDGPNNITRVVSAYDILNDSLWDRKMQDALKDKVYITIDLDVFDVSIMPAVGTPEPGGLGWYLMLDILKLVVQSKEIVGFDVVELSPLDGNVAPDFLASKLIYRLLGYIFYGKSKKK
ncbi:MAG: agmatinase [Candidatus Omnitrophica bacterium]|nr:agmatinase [Candidatus Omnitrophota bacterium]